MKLLIVDTSPGLRGVGGASRVASSLFYDLRKKGISTYYLGQKSDYISKGKNTFFLGGGGWTQRQAKQYINSGLRSLAESWPARAAYYSVYSMTKHSNEEMERWVSRAKPDIVIASSVQDYLLLKSLAKQLGSAKLIYIDHANLSGSYGSSLEYNKLGFTLGTGPYAGLEGAKKRFFSLFDGVVALNKEQFRAIKRFNRNVTIIHSSMLIRSTKVGTPKMQALRRSLRIKKGDKVVLYLGRLSEQQKNIGTLIKAFRSIENPKIRLLIVGDGKSKELYERMSQGDGRISVVGRVDDRMLAYYYSLAGLYVLPSIWEAFNATMIEAAHFGASLLLSTSSINEDIAERFGEELYTFDPYKREELRWKIEKYFNDPELQKRLHTLSKEIDAEYSKKKQIDSYAVTLKYFYKKGKFPES